jgi:hypothetical protein
LESYGSVLVSVVALITLVFSTCPGNSLLG